MNGKRFDAGVLQTEGYLDDVGQVAQLDPLDGCIGGLPAVDDGPPAAETCSRLTASTAPSRPRISAASL